MTKCNDTTVYNILKNTIRPVLEENLVNILKNNCFSLAIDDTSYLRKNSFGCKICWGGLSCVLFLKVYPA